MNSIIRVLMREIVGRQYYLVIVVTDSYFCFWGRKKWQDVSLSDKLSQQPAPQPVASCVNAPEAVHLTKICPSVNF